jgi:hypothetical protein
VSGVDITYGDLLDARLLNVERLAASLGVQLPAPDWEDPDDVAAYRRALCDAVARRTDRKFFRRGGYF